MKYENSSSRSLAVMNVKDCLAYAQAKIEGGKPYGTHIRARGAGQARMSFPRGANPDYLRLEDKMTERWHRTDVAVARKKTTVYLDPDLLRAIKVLAASTGRREYEVIEDALRQYLNTPQAGTSRQALRELLSQLDTHSELSDEKALDLAYAELHAARRERRRD